MQVVFAKEAYPRDEIQKAHPLCKTWERSTERNPSRSVGFLWRAESSQAPEVREVVCTFCSKGFSPSYRKPEGKVSGLFYVEKYLRKEGANVS